MLLGKYHMHCDTLWKVMDLDRQGDFMENQGSISIPGMQKAGTMAQFFACFTHLEDYQAKGAYDKGYARIQEMIRFLDEQVETYGDVLAHGYSRREILENKEKGKISAVLTVEDGGVLNGDMDRLDTLYHSGVRLMTLMWNHENCLGHPNSPKASDMWQGLKPFGRQVVERMGELRMIVDISHASDGTARDALECARGPVVASHSNCRALCPHPRNLTDEMLRALGEKGGVAGLNFYSEFLRKGRGIQADSQMNAGRMASVEDIADHAVWMIRKAGEDAVALGTDFDGFEPASLPEGIRGVEDIEKVWDAMRKKGITPRQLDKIAYGNVMRVIREVWRC